MENVIGTHLAGTYIHTYNLLKHNLTILLLNK